MFVFKYHFLRKCERQLLKMMCTLSIMLEMCVCCMPSGMQELIMSQHGNLWPLIGVHSQVLAEVLDTAERWLVQGESQKSGNFSFYPTLPLGTDYSFIII